MINYYLILDNIKNQIILANYFSFFYFFLHEHQSRRVSLHFETKRLCLQSLHIIYPSTCSESTCHLLVYSLTLPKWPIAEHSYSFMKVENDFSYLYSYFFLHIFSRMTNFISMFFAICCQYLCYLLIARPHLLVCFS